MFLPGATGLEQEQPEPCQQEEEEGRTECQTSAQGESIPNKYLANRAE